VTFCCEQCSVYALILRFFSQRSVAMLLFLIQKPPAGSFRLFSLKLSVDHFEEKH